jgi:hypothetical protein
MKTRRSRMPDGGWRARRVLKCGDSPPLKAGRTYRLNGRAGSPPPAVARNGVGALPGLLPLFCFILLHSAFCLRVWGQYSIDWSTIDDGGGTSTGGVYTVSGTIGQPDAGMMSGGAHTLSGGFWGIVAAVQTEGAPWLTVTRSNNSVVVSWPLRATGWLLQAKTDLVTGASLWAEIPPPYQTNGANLQFTEPSPAGNKFYRLHKP